MLSKQITLSQVNVFIINLYSRLSFRATVVYGLGVCSLDKFIAKIFQVKKKSVAFQKFVRLITILLYFLFLMLFYH